MRTLFVTRWPPDSLAGGAPLRNAQNIAALAAMGPVDVLSVEAGAGPSVAPNVSEWRRAPLNPRVSKRRGAWLFAKGWHPITGPYSGGEARDTCAQMCKARTYDLAVVEEISLAPFVTQFRELGVRVVFDAHNVEAALRKTIAAQTGGALKDKFRNAVMDRRLEAIERRACRDADLVWACSDLDAAAIRDAYAPRGTVSVTPNTVNVASYRDVWLKNAVPPSDGPVALTYVGTLSYQPNEAAALYLIERILPALRARDVEVKATIIGREPTAALIDAAASDADVDLTGPVPDVRPYFETPSVMALPIFSGSGTRLKILEAFAMGVPVVGTAKGVEGIDVAHGREMRVCETAETFAEEILALWRDPVAYAAQRDAAHALVATSYSWEAAAERIADSLTDGGAK